MVSFLLPSPTQNLTIELQVYGPSMVPTFSAVTDWILEDTLSVHLGRPLVRGQVVVLKSPRTPGDQICKRIIGLPGDVICVDPIGKDAEAKEHVIIPQGHIWIAGDNSAASIDSRVYGPVPMALVRARVVAGVSCNLRCLPSLRALIWRLRYSLGGPSGQMRL